MENVEGNEGEVIIPFDGKIFSRSSKKYYFYDWRMRISKIPYRFLLFFSLGLISIGWWKEISFLLSFGLIIGGLTAIFLGYFLLKYVLSYRKLERENKVFQQSGHSLIFRYDLKGWEKEWNGITIKVEWGHVNYAIINDDDIYLFDEKQRLLELFSHEMIPYEDFEAIKSLLVLKQKMRK